MSISQKAVDLRAVLEMIDGGIIEASDIERGFIAGVIYALENRPAN